MNIYIKNSRKITCKIIIYQSFYFKLYNHPSQMCEENRDLLRSELCREKSNEMTFGKHFNWIAGHKGNYVTIYNSNINIFMEL